MWRGGGRRGSAATSRRWDGKALRRSFEDAASRSPLHLVQAFSTHAKLVLGQVEVDGKSNEIPALPRLLELLDVEGRLVSGTPATTPATTGKRRRLWMGGMCRTWDDGIRQARNSRP